MDLNYIPVVPLISTIILPNTLTPLLIGREFSKNAVNTAMDDTEKIICVPQKAEIFKTEKQTNYIYRIGTLCKIIQILPLPDGNMRVLIEGQSRVKILRFKNMQNPSYLSAKYIEEPQILSITNVEEEALLRSFKKLFLEYVKLLNIPKETLKSFKDITDLPTVLYIALGSSSVDYHKKQEIYEIPDVYEAMFKFSKIINEEIQIIKLEKKIESEVKTKLNKMQREYFLSEQIRSINKELGISKEAKNEVMDFREKLKKTPIPNEVAKKVKSEIDKLARLNQMSPEYGVTYNYLTWIFDLPWKEPVFADFDLDEALKILNKDHYGLKKVKEHIIEYLAIVKIARKVKGQILCFVGPPGVGKTSLGKSIAKAMNRKFVRLSLGGVRDEAEIRGHRRTYVGALPGVIIQSMKRAQTKNPLIMMDEIDKMSMDFRGDPASALLEVLDPEQNNSFRDHYLDFEYDLSEVFFITTANTLSSIPQPLIDRMEVIEIPGYTSYEKINIASKHLIPKIEKELELKGKLKVKFKRNTIKNIIENYTREAGVREAERKIMNIYRKVAKKYVLGKIENSVIIEPKDLKEYLGVPPYLYSEANRKDSVGIVTGLAWTPFGGETLEIEVVRMPGDGKLKLTGQLGDVMQESAQAAFSYARLHYKEYGIEPDLYKKCDIHLHVPEGAIPKDGPSAGVTIVTALISVFSNKKVNHNIAMTGEITLTGQVLPIGGLAEKLIAAKRAKIKTVIIPAKNKPNYEELQEEIKKDINVVFVHTIKEVLDIALVK